MVSLLLYFICVSFFFFFFFSSRRRHTRWNCDWSSDVCSSDLATAPGHVAEVRRLVFDPLTRAQQRQIREIGRRIMRVIDPNDRCLDDRAPTPRHETPRDETP